MATHSSVLAWRIPGMAEPGGLPSMESHRVGHNCSGLAAAEELWTEVRDFVQEAGIKTIPKKKKCKKAKWLSEEALQIAEKRREVKGKKRKDIPI